MLVIIWRRSSVEHLAPTVTVQQPVPPTAEEPGDTFYKTVSHRASTRKHKESHYCRHEFIFNFSLKMINKKVKKKTAEETNDTVVGK